MAPSSIGEINLLPWHEKYLIYSQTIPQELLERFHLDREKILNDESGLFSIQAEPGTTTAEISLFHRLSFPDPVLYGQITDTISGQVHVLFYVLNDPDSPRFDIDRMPDGSLTKFGTSLRNIPAEMAALHYGLAPGQIRRGLRMLSPAIHAFEKFVVNLGHDMFFVEPLFYHNAVLFEWNGFGYQKGRLLMEKINQSLCKGGALSENLNSTFPFRQPAAVDSIRFRSWAIHDGILGFPFTDVTMYKHVGAHAGEDTCPGCVW